MGYSTNFTGEFYFDKIPSKELADYIKKFCHVKRVKRDNEKIKEIFPNWKELCYNGELGEEGEYFIGTVGRYENDESIIDYNRPPGCQPGLWCNWTIYRDECLEWNSAENFYNYIEWLEYLIERFFAPNGIMLNGEMEFEGDDRDDFGIIAVKDNIITVERGYIKRDIANIPDDILEKELERRRIERSK